MGTSYSQCFPSSNKSQPFYMCSELYLLGFHSRTLIILPLSYFISISSSLLDPFPSAFMHALKCLITTKNRSTNEQITVPHLQKKKNPYLPPISSPLLSNFWPELPIVSLSNSSAPFPSNLFQPLHGDNSC